MGQIKDEPPEIWITKKKLFAFFFNIYPLQCSELRLEFSNILIFSLYLYILTYNFWLGDIKKN